MADPFRPPSFIIRPTSPKVVPFPKLVLAFLLRLSTPVKVPHLPKLALPSRVEFGVVLGEGIGVFGVGAGVSFDEHFTAELEVVLAEDCDEVHFLYESFPFELHFEFMEFRH